MKNFDIALFDGFETLDAFGPTEIIAHMPGEYALAYRSASGGVVESAQGVRVETRPLSEVLPGGVLLIPGGVGTRALSRDAGYLRALAELAGRAAFVLSVCTGSGLLAATGFLDGRSATSNKRVFEWACSMGPAVNWIRKARWVRDGDVYTSSGVTAGMDMTLGFLADIHGADAARRVADGIEYVWNEDPACDPFAG